MCLAEVGEDPASAWQEADASIWMGVDVDRRTAWRAVEIAFHEGAPICFACFSAANVVPDIDAHRAARDACLATHPCVEDCGLPDGRNQP